LGKLQNSPIFAALQGVSRDDFFILLKDRKDPSCKLKKIVLLPLQKDDDGAVAQLVEQRTENPCVGGSIPPHTTKSHANKICVAFLFFNARAGILR
jgi:hypothetical protein